MTAAVLTGLAAALGLAAGVALVSAIVLAAHGIDDEIRDDRKWALIACAPVLLGLAVMCGQLA